MTIRILQDLRTARAAPSYSRWRRGSRPRRRRRNVGSRSDGLRFRHRIRRRPLLPRGSGRLGGGRRQGDRGGQRVVIDGLAYSAASPGAAVARTGVAVVPGRARLGARDTWIQWTFSVPAAGLYTIAVEYYPCRAGAARCSGRFSSTASCRSARRTTCCSRGSGRMKAHRTRTTGQRRAAPAGRGVDVAHPAARGPDRRPPRRRSSSTSRPGGTCCAWWR